MPTARLSCVSGGSGGVASESTVAASSAAAAAVFLETRFRRGGVIFTTIVSSASCAVAAAADADGGAFAFSALFLRVLASGDGLTGWTETTCVVSVVVTFDAARFPAAAGTCTDFR